MFYVFGEGAAAATAGSTQRARTCSRRFNLLHFELYQWSVLVLRSICRSHSYSLYLCGALYSPINSHTLHHSLVDVPPARQRLKLTCLQACQPRALHGSQLVDLGLVDSTVVESMHTLSSSDWKFCMPQPVLGCEQLVRVSQTGCLTR